MKSICACIVAANLAVWLLFTVATFTSWFPPVRTMLTIAGCLWLAVFVPLTVTGLMEAK